MKFLTVFLVVLLGYFFWRSSRASARKATPPDERRRDVIAQDMVACAHCGLHLPGSDAVLGRNAHYCSPEHLKLAGDRAK